MASKKEQATLKVNVSGDLQKLEAQLQRLGEKGVKTNLVPIRAAVTSIKSLGRTTESLKKAFGTNGLLKRLRETRTALGTLKDRAYDNADAFEASTTSISAFTLALKEATVGIKTGKIVVGGGGGGNTAALASGRQTSTVIRKELAKTVDFLKNTSPLVATSKSGPAGPFGKATATAEKALAAKFTTLGTAISGLRSSISQLALEYKAVPKSPLHIFNRGTPATPPNAGINRGRGVSSYTNPLFDNSINTGFHDARRGPFLGSTKGIFDSSQFKSSLASVKKYSGALDKLRGTFKKLRVSGSFAMGHINKAADRSTKSFKEGDRALGDYVKFIAKFAVASTIVFGFARGVQSLVAGFKDLVAVGVEYNKIVETAQVGIASIIVSQGSIYETTSDGLTKELTGLEAVQKVRKISIDQLNKLRIESLKTTATVEELSFAFQQAVGPGLGAGISNFDTLRRITVDIVRGAGAIGVPMRQLNEEVRSLLTGAINPINSRLAAVLGITGKMVKDWKEQGVLADRLLGKLKAFEKSGEIVVKTFEGIKSNIIASISSFSGTAFTGFFDQLKIQMQGIVESIVPNVDTGLFDEKLLVRATKLNNLLEDLVKHIDPLVDRFLVFTAAIEKHSTAISNAVKHLKNLLITYTGLKILGKLRTAFSVGNVRFRELGEIAKSAGASTVFLDKVLGKLIKNFPILGVGIKLVASAFRGLGSIPIVALLIASGGFLAWEIFVKFSADKQFTHDFKNIKDKLDELQAKANESTKVFAANPEAANTFLTKLKNNLAVAAQLYDSTKDKVKKTQDEIDKLVAKKGVEPGILQRITDAVTGTPKQDSALDARNDKLNKLNIKLKAQQDLLLAIEKVLKDSIGTYDKVHAAQEKATITAQGNLSTQKLDKSFTKLFEAPTKLLDKKRQFIVDATKKIAQLDKKIANEAEGPTRQADKATKAVEQRHLALAKLSVANEEATNHVKQLTVAERSLFGEINKNTDKFEKLANLKKLQAQLASDIANTPDGVDPAALEALGKTYRDVTQGIDAAGISVDKFYTELENKGSSKALDPVDALIKKYKELEITITGVLNNPNATATQKEQFAKLLKALPAQFKQASKGVIDQSNKMYFLLTKGLVTWKQTFLDVMTSLKDGWRNIVYNTLTGDVKGLKTSFKDIGKAITRAITNKIADDLFKGFLTKLGILGANPLQVAANSLEVSSSALLEAAGIMASSGGAGSFGSGGGNSSNSGIGPTIDNARRLYGFAKGVDSNPSAAGNSSTGFFSKMSNWFNSTAVGKKIASGSGWLHESMSSFSSSKIGGFFKTGAKAYGAALTAYQLGSAAGNLVHNPKGVGLATGLGVAAGSIGTSMGLFMPTAGPLGFVAGAGVFGGTALANALGIKKRGVARTGAGIAGGAATGAAIGAAFGGISAPIGAIVGAIAGGIASLFGGEKLVKLKGTIKTIVKRQGEKILANSSGSLSNYKTLAHEDATGIVDTLTGKFEDFIQGQVELISGLPKKLQDKYIGILNSPEMQVLINPKSSPDAERVAKRATADLEKGMIKVGKTFSIPAFIDVAKNGIKKLGLDPESLLKYANFPSAEKLQAQLDAIVIDNSDNVDQYMQAIQDFYQGLSDTAQNLQDFMNQVGQQVESIKSLVKSKIDFSLQVGSEINDVISSIPGTETEVFNRLQNTRKTMLDALNKANAGTDAQAKIDAAKNLESATNAVFSFVQSHPDRFFGKEFLSIREQTLNDLKQVGKAGNAGFDGLIKVATDQLKETVGVKNAIVLLDQHLTGLNGINGKISDFTRPQTTDTLANTTGNNTVAFTPNITINADLNNLTDSEVTELLITALREGSPELIAGLRNAVTTI